jgi:hypothetical protein
MSTDVESTTTDAIAATNDGLTRTPRRPGQTLACGWCGSLILLPARGRIPKWCSSSCRHRAWELTRAAASGRAAVQVVDRVVEVDRLVTVVQEVPVTSVPQGAEWPAALAQLATALDTGRVYDRDLPALAQALAGVADALDRRPGRRLRKQGRLDPSRATAFRAVPPAPHLLPYAK